MIKRTGEQSSFQPSFRLNLSISFHTATRFLGTIPVIWEFTRYSNPVGNKNFDNVFVIDLD